jgi:hypothetical protein
MGRNTAKQLMGIRAFSSNSYYIDNGDTRTKESDGLVDVGNIVDSYNQKGNMVNSLRKLRILNP